MEIAGSRATVIGDNRRWPRPYFFSRFQTRYAVPPPEGGVGLITRISSPLMVMMRFCSLPFQLGKDPAAMRIVIMPSGLLKS
jgi:hypothetical protein